MKYSNTAIKELSSKYKNVLKKCALLNAALMIGMIMTAGSAQADTTGTPVSVDTGAVQITENITGQTISTNNTAGAVTINANNNQVTIADGVSLSDNTVTSSSGNAGGGIKALNGFTAGNNLTISNNISNMGGGIYVRAAQNSSGTTQPSNRDVTIGSATYEGNRANWLGGALGIETADTVQLGESTFKNNTAINDGGAIAVWTDSTDKLNGSVIEKGTVVTIAKSDFDGNVAGNRGGAIANLNNDTTPTAWNNTIHIASGSTFTNNSAAVGGAIYSVTGMDLDGLTFENNKATSGTVNTKGGAVALDGPGTSSTISNSIFRGNESIGTNNSESSGGAVSSNNGTLTINNSQFYNNKATHATKWANGGAISTTYNAKDKPRLLTVNDSYFEGNEASSDGGAISAYDLTKINNSTFKGNTAHGLDSGSVWTRSTGGGAIYIGGTAGMEISNSQFLSNVSDGDGGAIATRDKALNTALTTFKTVSIASSTFADNTADRNGGAIFNSVGTQEGMQISDSTFTNNTAAGKGGAIYNVGILNLSGNNTFSGNKANNAANDIYNDGTVNVAGTLALDGGITGNGTVNFAEGSYLKTALMDSTAVTPVITADKVTGSTNLVIENGSLGGALGIKGASENSLIFADNALYDITASSQAGDENNKTFIVSKKSAEDAVNSLTASGAGATEAQTIHAMTEAAPTDAHAQAIATAITTAAQTGDTGTAASLAKAVNPVETPVIQAHAVGTSTQVVTTAMNRMGAESEGRSGGSMADFAYGPWIQGLYNKTHNSQGDGFNGYMQGFALGVDVDVTDSTMVGAGYAYSATDIKSNGRKTQVYGDNYFLYGKYQPAAWYVKGAFNYGHANYKETSLGLIGKYNVDTYGGQILGGYQKGIFDNYAGVRYTYVNPDDYSNGLTEVKAKNSQVATAIIGTKISKEFKQQHVTWKPEFRLAGTYDFKADNNSSIVGIVGGSTTYMVQGKRLHRAAAVTGVGLTATVLKNMDITLGYDAEFREDQTSQTGSVKLQYNF